MVYPEVGLPDYAKSLKPGTHKSGYILHVHHLVKPRKTKKKKLKPALLPLVLTFSACTPANLSQPVTSNSTYPSLKPEVTPPDLSVTRLPTDFLKANETNDIGWHSFSYRRQNK